MPDQEDYEKDTINALTKQVEYLVRREAWREAEGSSRTYPLDWYATVKERYESTLAGLGVAPGSPGRI